MRKNFGPNNYLYPMPVLIIAAYDENGVPCCMNAAWGGISQVNHVSMCVSPGHKTVKNLLNTGEFTVSVGDAANLVACDYVGLVSGNDVPDKFEKAGFHAEKADAVNAPLIKELGMALECKVKNYDDITHVLTGEILNVSADESVLGADGTIDVAKIRPICFDPVHHKYHVLGEAVGDAFADGKKIK